MAAASGRGGAAFVYGPGTVLKLEDSTFLSNAAVSDGGAVFAGHGASIEIVPGSTVVVQGNTAAFRAPDPCKNNPAYVGPYGYPCGSIDLQWIYDAQCLQDPAGFFSAEHLNAMRAGCFVQAFAWSGFRVKEQ